MNKCPYKFTELERNYPHEPREALFSQMGWDSLVGSDAYQNTCAIRVSICLLRCGMTITNGELTIWKGSLSKRQVKIRFDGLADFLSLTWGAPEKFSLENYKQGITGREGIIVFWQLPGGYPGHIDIHRQDKGIVSHTYTTIEPYFFGLFTRETKHTVYRTAMLPPVCGSGCYFGSKEIWFWEAP